MITALCVVFSDGYIIINNTTYEKKEFDSGHVKFIQKL